MKLDTAILNALKRLFDTIEEIRNTYNLDADFCSIHVNGYITQATESNMNYSGMITQAEEQIEIQISTLGRKKSPEEVDFDWPIKDNGHYVKVIRDIEARNINYYREEIARIFLNHLAV